MLIQALNNAPAALVVVAAKKADWPVQFVNAAAAALLDKPVDEIIGLSFRGILADGRIPEISLGQDYGPQGYSTDLQDWRRSDGENLRLQVRMTPILDRHERPEYLMISVVSPHQGRADDDQPADAVRLRNKLQAARRTIKSLQRTDSVTGLARRGFFEEILERDWAIARREQDRVAVIVFEVDCFDEYQQIFGRHATDSLLQKIGHAIAGTLRRAGDLGARISNNRFAVLIGNADPDQALACANRVATKVRNLSIHHPRSTKARFATVSFGVAAEIPAWSAQSNSLLEAAENSVGSVIAVDQDLPVKTAVRNETAAETVD